MNKYLMLSAAALVASTSGAAAANASRTDTVTFDGYCGSVRIVHSGPQYNAAFFSCGGALTGIGFGLAQKTKGMGRHVDISDNQYGNNRSIAVNTDFSLPFRTGGTWGLWIEFSGVSSFLGNSGTYSVNVPAHQGKGKSLTAETRALIERLRAAKGQHR
jgi:hypothetical protein